jgi:nucleotide-binding universal stress UspA family protein
MTTDQGPPRVVVGVDDTHGSRQALRWAIAFAERHRRPLWVVTCVEIPVATGAAEGLMAASATLLEEMHQRGQQINDAAVATARARLPDVHGVVTVQSPVSALADSARPQDVLVIGAAAETGSLPALFGSVATATVHRAKSPTVVVRHGVLPQRVLVGTDGSTAADTATAWAEAEAEALGTRLASCTCPPSPSPEENLVAACEPDDLLVVGCRGRGALASAVLGSVSRYVVRHAPCNVAVIH